MHLLRFVLCFALLATLNANKISQSSDDGENEAAENGSIIRELAKRVEVIEERDKKQTKLIEALERDHKREVVELKQELANQKAEIAILRKKSTRQDHMLSKLVRRMELQGRTFVKAPKGGKVEDQQTSVGVNRIRRLENEMTVAFTAGLTKRFLHAGAHQNIIFDHVETNKGNGYNPHHGVFTAPVSGLYMFFTSILADNDREVWCEIVVNGTTRASVYARGTDTRHDQGSQMIITQLQQGADVAVQNLAVDDAIYGDRTFYSTFSGFLLEQGFPGTDTIVG